MKSVEALFIKTDTFSVGLKLEVDAILVSQAATDLYNAYSSIKATKSSFDVVVRQLEIFKRELMQPEASEPCGVLHSMMKSCLEGGDGDRHRQEIGRMLGNLTGLQAL